MSQGSGSECSSNSDLDEINQLEEETWEDWTEDSQLTLSLFDESKTFKSSLESLNYDKLTFGVDLILLASTLG